MADMSYIEVMKNNDTLAEEKAYADEVARVASLRACAALNAKNAFRGITLEEVQAKS